jgi:hypothetical protein
MTREMTRKENVKSVWYGRLKEQKLLGPQLTTGIKIITRRKKERLHARERLRSHTNRHNLSDPTEPERGEIEREGGEVRFTFLSIFFHFPRTFSRKEER